MSLIEDLVAPELDKMQKADRKAKPISEFMEWLEEDKGVEFPAPINDLIYEYFGINKEKAKKEMAQIREARNAAAQAWREDVFTKVRETSADELSETQVAEFVSALAGMSAEEQQEVVGALPEATKKRVDAILGGARKIVDNLLEEAGEE